MTAIIAELIERLAELAASAAEEAGASPFGACVAYQVTQAAAIANHHQPQGGEEAISTTTKKPDTEVVASRRWSPDPKEGNTHMHLEFSSLESPNDDYILRSQTFPVRMAGATRVYLLCMPCVTFEAVCVYVHDPDHADEWEEHRCICDYIFEPKTGLGAKTPWFDGDEEAYAWSLHLLASDAEACRRLIQLCEDMKIKELKK